MIYRLFPTKDTFISNVQRNSIQQTGSNFGASEIIDLIKYAGISGTIGVRGTASISRGLLQFDFSQISHLTASGLAPSSSIGYTLTMFDARHAGQIPSSFDVLIAPVTKSWDEGKGLDNDDYKDKGFCCWTHAMSNDPWVNPGSDFTLAQTSSVHFDTGFEDLRANVTSMVNRWLTGGLENKGLVMMYSGSYETSYTTLGRKSFHGRTTNYRDKRPYIEAVWDDSLRDDRGCFIFGTTGSLFLYNVRGGQLENLSIGQNTLRVSIVDSSGTLMTVTGSHTGITGIYSASFALPTGSYSGSIFYDRWGSGSFAFMSGVFYPSVQTATSFIGPKQYSVKVKNLRTEYETNERIRFDIFVRTRGRYPATVQTSSLDTQPFIVRKCYYRIDNDMTKEQVIPFGTGSVESTRLSYDVNGNYFNFYMSSLTPGNLYRIVFLFDENGERQLIDNGIRFKLV